MAMGNAERASAHENFETVESGLVIELASSQMSGENFLVR